MGFKIFQRGATTTNSNLYIRKKNQFCLVFFNSGSQVQQLDLYTYYYTMNDTVVSC